MESQHSIRAILSMLWYNIPWFVSWCLCADWKNVSSWIATVKREVCVCVCVKSTERCVCGVCVCSHGWDLMNPSKVREEISLLHRHFHSFYSCIHSKAIRTRHISTVIVVTTCIPILAYSHSQTQGWGIEYQQTDINNTNPQLSQKTAYFNSTYYNTFITILPTES